MIGTGKSHSIKDFLKIAFNEAGLGNYKKYVDIDPHYYRPTEVDHLVADISKTKKVIGWKPKIKFEQLVRIMLKHDLENNGLRKEAEKIKTI